MEKDGLWHQKKTLVTGRVSKTRGSLAREELSQIFIYVYILGEKGI